MVAGMYGIHYTVEQESRQGPSQGPLVHLEKMKACEQERYETEGSGMAVAPSPENPSALEEPSYELLRGSGDRRPPSRKSSTAIPRSGVRPWKHSSAVQEDECQMTDHVGNIWVSVSNQVAHFRD